MSDTVAPSLTAAVNLLGHMLFLYDKYKDFTIFFIQKGSVQTPIKLEQEEVPSAKERRCYFYPLFSAL